MVSFFAIRDLIFILMPQALTINILPCLIHIRVLSFVGPSSYIAIYVDIMRLDGIVDDMSCELAT